MRAVQPATFLRNRSPSGRARNNTERVRASDHGALATANVRFCGLAVATDEKSAPGGTSSLDLVSQATAGRSQVEQGRDPLPDGPNGVDEGEITVDILSESRILVCKLNDDIVLEVEVASSTVEDLKVRVFETTRIQPYRQQLVMDGEELPILGPGISAELRSLVGVQQRTLNAQLVELEQDTESMAPMAIMAPLWHQGTIAPRPPPSNK